MYKIITLIVILSITSMPVAIAAEVPFYLKDRSRLPNRTVDPKNNLYIPSKSQYADWLVKRASEVSSKLDECNKELDGYKTVTSEKENSEKNWVLVKINKKKNYLKFLNEKFEKVTGSSLADAGYNFNLQDAKEKLTVVEKEASPELEQSLKVELAQKKEEPTIAVLGAAITQNSMPIETPAVIETVLADMTKQDPIKTEEKSTAVMSSESLMTPSKELTTQTKKNESADNTDKIPTQNPETNTPNLPTAMEMKEPEEKDDDHKLLPESSKVDLVEEKIEARKESSHIVTEKDLAMLNDEQEKKEDTTSESLLIAPLSIVENNRKEVVQKLETEKNFSSRKTTVVSQVSESKLPEENPDLTSEIPLTAPVINSPIIEQKSEVVTEQATEKKEPLIVETKTVKTVTEEKMETPEVDSAKKETSVSLKDEKTISPTDAVRPINVESERSIEETKSVTTIVTEESPTVVLVDPAKEKSKKEEMMMDNLISQKKKEFDLVKTKKEIDSSIKPSATPAQVKSEAHEDLAPVEAKLPVVAAPAHDRIMEEGEIQEDNGPSY